MKLPSMKLPSMKSPSHPSLYRPRVRQSALAFAALAFFAAVAVLGVAGCARRSPTAEPPQPAVRAELTLSAAASLTDVLRAALPAFERAHPGVIVHLNLGSSGALANQIAQGAPADAFIAAGEEPVSRLVQQGLVDAPTVERFVENRLVLIIPADGPQAVKDWADLTNPAVRHIALANPAHVPAGQYGQATLEALGLWDKVQPRLVFGEDVRQTMQFVEAGEADAGLVYQTDAATSRKVKVAAQAPAGSHPPIVYPIAFVKGSRHPQQAQALITYLLGPEVAAELRAAGFEVNR
ncbi:MAG: molybdate ABC transporter substrate-binding protein [Symbiobacteriia bacterium]